MSQLLGLCGSLRAASLNRKLLLEAARSYAPETFAEADLRLPLYDGDLQDRGLPEAVTRLIRQIDAADAVIIATPEYNKGISGVLKNALDWISRGEIKPWDGKPVALMSATAGRSGGERMQAMVRLCLQPFRPNLLQGPEVLVGGAAKEFDDTGHLISERYIAAVGNQMQALKSLV